MEKKVFKTVVVIPAFNEGQVIGQVVTGAIKAGFADIVVVNDGSTDDTAEQATRSGAIVISHKVNRGKGAATTTGLKAALILRADFVVTMDGDGQHDPADLPVLVNSLIAGEADVVLGSRLKSAINMPYVKVWQNRVANFITWSISGLWVKDSQSGFRGYSREALEKINVKADNYNFESEIIGSIVSQRLKFKEVPVKVNYTNYSNSKAHRQSLGNGIKTLYKLIYSKLVG